ncbi:MAG: TetR/AcrR family transcriptional regulator [Pseudomonadaceae bacterium]|nr:TetR/AcrR family transcriptional regulator [Pseudomonadaceae bacterium]
MVTTSPDTAAAIFEAAARLMIEQGEGGLRVDAVATEAGCNKRLIYHYFGNRDGLIAAVYHRQCQVLLSPDNGLSDDARRFLHQQLQHIWPELETPLDTDESHLQGAIKRALVLLAPLLLRAIADEQAEPLLADSARSQWRKVSAEVIDVVIGSETAAPADALKKVSERSHTSSKPRYRMASASRVVD